MWFVSGSHLLIRETLVQTDFRQKITADSVYSRLLELYILDKIIIRHLINMKTADVKSLRRGFVVVKFSGWFVILY